MAVAISHGEPRAPGPGPAEPERGRGAEASEGWADVAGPEHGRSEPLTRHVRVIGGAGGLVGGARRQGGRCCDQARRA